MRKSALLFNNIVWHNELFASHGFSIFFIFDNTKILFDTGFNDFLIKNAKFMNINLEQSDFIIISHAHNDHTNGLKYLKQKTTNKLKLYLPKNFDKSIFSKRGNQIKDISSELKIENLKDKFNIEIITKTTKIKNNITMLYTEKKVNYFEDKERTKPIILSEISLILANSLIVGCSHFGIIEILKKALKINPKITLIAGGMHLLKTTNKELDNIAKQFFDLGIKTVYPMHCSGTKIVSYSEKYNIKTTLPGVGFSFELV